jgi:transcriptional regulator with XRE-family HTH domain
MFVALLIAALFAYLEDMGKKRSPTSQALSLRVQQAFGLRLRAVRQASPGKTSQSDLATALEVTRTSICNIENGRHRVFLDQIYAAANLLQVPVTDLLPDDTTFFAPPTVTSPLSAGFDAKQLGQIAAIVEAVTKKQLDGKHNDDEKTVPSRRKKRK